MGIDRRAWCSLKSRCALAAVLLGTVLFSSAAEAQLTQGRRFEKGATCDRCHEDVLQGLANIHAPLAEGDCESCHKPHGLVGALRLTQDEPALCLECHERDALRLDEGHRHPEVENCSSCHSPHGSNHGALLKAAESSLCTDCHADVTHGSFQHVPLADGCTSCHVAHGGGEPQLLKATEPALCLECHDVDLSFAHQDIDVSSMSCATCHPPHAGADGLLRASVHVGGDCSLCHADPETPVDGSICLECHDPPSVFLWEGSVHPAAVDGDCLDCHAPHGSDHAPMLAEAETVLCGSCHDEQSMALQGEHGHDVASCSDCHAGHESSHEKLLKAPSRDLCVECHDDPRDAGHDMVHQPANSNCLACHDAHGTGLPALVTDLNQNNVCGHCHSDVVATGGLPNVHEPFVNGDCTGCHNPHSGPSMLLLAEGEKLCTSCHEPLMAEAENRKEQHVPFEEGACDTCHLPHATEHRALLVDEEADLCATCHEVETTKPLGGSDHPPVTTGDCSACHQSHAADVTALLKAPSAVLCTSCHPDVGERLDQEIAHAPAADDCQTCHLPHVARHPNLLAQAVSVGCLDCHDADAAGWREKHLGLTAAGMDCGGCHDPHAAPEPGLMLPVQHAPFADGDCSMCHKSLKEKGAGQ